MTDRIASIRERIAASRAASEGVSRESAWWSARNLLTARIANEREREFVAHHSPERIAALLADLEAALAVVEAARVALPELVHGADSWGARCAAPVHAALSTFDTP